MSNQRDDLFTGPGFETEQLSDGGLNPGADLIALLGLGHRFAGDAVLRGADPNHSITPSAR